MNALSRCCSLVLVATLLTGGAGRAQEGAAKDPALEEARSHVNKAKVHYDLGEYEQAAEEYILVYRIKALPALLFNIAQAYRQAGQYEKAKQFYKSFLRESPDQKSKPVIEKAIKEIDELLARDKRAKELKPNGTAEASQLTQPAQETQKSAPAAAQKVPAQPSPAPRAPPLAASTAAARPPETATPPAQASPRPAAQPATATSDQGRPVAVVATTPRAQRPAAPSAVTHEAVPTAATSVEAETPLYKKWWLWTAVGVVAVGAGAAALSTGGNTAPGSHFGTSKVFP